MPGGEPLSQTVGNEIPNGSCGMSLKGTGSESLRELSLEIRPGTWVFQPTVRVV